MQVHRGVECLSSRNDATSAVVHDGRMTRSDGARTTGRYLLVMSDAVFGDDDASREAVRAVTGVRDVTCTRDAESSALDRGQTHSSDAVLFAELGIAVVTPPAGRIGTAGVFAPSDDRIVAVEPERILHALRPRPVETVQQAFVDRPEATWGLQATGVLTAAESGAGVTVAVLDTGFDLQHPDFRGPGDRVAVLRRRMPAQDVQGHGTHCAGTATGRSRPGRVRGTGWRTGRACSWARSSTTAAAAPTPTSSRA